MFQFHTVYTWKGVYHFSADFAHWYGWAHLQMSVSSANQTYHAGWRSSFCLTPYGF